MIWFYYLYLIWHWKMILLVINMRHCLLILCRAISVTFRPVWKCRFSFYWNLEKKVMEVSIENKLSMPLNVRFDSCYLIQIYSASNQRQIEEMKENFLHGHPLNQSQIAAEVGSNMLDGLGNPGGGCVLVVTKNL